MNFWSTSHNITIACLPLTKFLDTHIHQARKSSWGFG